MDGHLSLCEELDGMWGVASLSRRVLRCTDMALRVNVRSQTCPQGHGIALVRHKVSVKFSSDSEQATGISFLPFFVPMRTSNCFFWSQRQKVYS